MRIKILGTYEILRSASMWLNQRDTLTYWDDGCFVKAA